MTIERIITELVRKECEAYQLIDLGLLSSVKEGVGLLLPLIEPIDLSDLDDFNRFRVWRKKVLSQFYKQLNYARFIQRVSDLVTFRVFLFTLNKRIIARLREQTEIQTIDRVLSISGKTFAFKLSLMLNEEFLKEEHSTILLAETPIMLEEICWNYCREFFPIDMERLMIRLERDDSEFWDDLYLTINTIAQTVISGQSVSIQYRKDVLQEMWTETSLLLHDKFLMKNIPFFESALHFRNYIARMCLNKCREAIRKYNLPSVMLTVTGEIPIETYCNEEVSSVVDLNEWILSDIDCENEDEVRRGLTIILWDKLEPWYSELTQGIENKTELLFLHYVEGLSYEEIVDIKNPKVSVEGRTRLAGKFRQDVVRVRRLLKQRFVELLKRN